MAIQRHNALLDIMAKPNVTIHQSFDLGEYSNINIWGECGEFRIEENVSTRRFCNFLVYPAARLIIHKNVFMNNYCSINCLGSIEIGENTLFGEGVKLYDHNHKYQYNQAQELVVERNDFKVGSIKIGKNCWIGSNVTILNNVEIGDNTIIGAHNLVYKSVEPNSVIKAANSHL